MSKYNNIAKGCFGFWIACLLMSGCLNAEKPMWTYSAPLPARVTISDGEMATVQYTVTNESYATKNLILRATAGLSASACHLVGKGGTCNVTLTIDGNLIPQQGIHGGPFLCEQGNSNQCYQPSSEHTLKIDRGTMYRVTPIAGTHVNSIIPSGVQTVKAGSTHQFIVSLDAGYTLNLIGGTCPVGQWSGVTYTTGAITSDCSVSFNARMQQSTISVSPKNITLTTDPGNTAVVSVKNTSTVAYNINTILATPAYGVMISSTTCGSVLTNQDICTITFEMGAGGSIGTTSATIQAENSNSQSVAISVISPLAPVLSISSPAQAERVIPVSNGSLDIVVTSDNPIAPNTDISVSLPAAWGGSVTASYTNCSSVAPGDFCIIHLQATAPFVADQITINGTNGAGSLSTYVAFRAGGGLVFSVNGGVTKVLKEMILPSSPIAWGGYGYQVGGINTSSTAGAGSCDGSNDGACNTQRIVNCLTNLSGCVNTPHSGIMMNTYAAGLCSDYNDGSYSDWFLPAICEWSNWMSNCTVDNIAINLHQHGFGALDTDYYWSSTELESIPAYNAWSQIFTPMGNGSSIEDKRITLAVRCVRSF